MNDSMIDGIKTFLELGGPVVALLLALSVFALALVILKLVQFARERVGFHGRAGRALHAWFHGSPGEARRMLEGDASALGAVLATAIRLVSGGTMPRGAIEEEVGRIALGRLHELQRGFRALDAIAQIAPLLGLFGTVLGMIEAFRQLQEAGSAVDPSLLAGGIWVALLTTAAGLAVAMPVSLVLAWFEARLENERVAIETMSGAVIARTDASGSANAAAPETPRAFAEPGHAH